MGAAVMQIMTRVEATGVVTVVVEGTLSASSVPAFDRALQSALKLDQPVVLDLSSVTLIDRPTLKYLIHLMQDEFRLVISPDYVEHWIDRESSRESIE
jgi:anti-anti-sigma regulatory factor